MLTIKNKVRMMSVLVILAMIFSFANVSLAVAAPLPKVAVYGSDNPSWTVEVIAKLTATGAFQQVDNLSPLGCHADPTPTLATLQQYSAVLVYSNCSFNNTVILGNVLADYIDGGGVVVVSTFALWTENVLGIGGRFDSGGYLPLTQGSQSQGTRLFLVADLPSDPLLAGVTSFDGGSSSYHNNPVSLAAGATLVAHWTNGQPLVAYKGNVVALNFFPPSNDSRSDFWNSVTDGVRLMTNALNFNLVTNEPPTASAGGPYQSNEGSGIAMSGATASDPDVSDTLTYSWSVDSALCSFDNASALNPNLTCDDNGNFTATLEVSDGVNPPVTSDAAVTVDNVAPTASLGNDGPIDEGTSATISFSGVFDPSSVDSASLHYAFDCNGGSLSAATYAGSLTSNSTSCAFADNGNYTVSGKIMDKDGGSNEYTTVVTVDNVAPTITSLVAGAAMACGQSNSLTVNFDDPALANDTYTANVDWGDGNSDTYNAVSSGFSASHAYALAGIYTVSVTVSDEDGGTSASMSTTLTLNFTIVGGVQPPINQDGTSVFKYKSTIPVKLKVTDCNGSTPGALTIKIMLTMVSGATPGLEINEPVSTSAADTSGFMRFSENQYIYNLATKPLPDPSATYKITLTIMQTGQTITVNFGLKP